jgi:Flp pilus assembly protein TadG
MLYAISKRLRRDRRGAAMMEFAFVAPVLLMLLLGTIELSRYFATQQSVRTLSAEAARAAYLNTSIDGCPPSNSVVTTVNKTTPFLSLAPGDVCINRTTDASGRNVVTVSVTYPFSTMVPYLAFLNGNFSNSTQLTYSPH